MFHKTVAQRLHRQLLVYWPLNEASDTRRSWYAKTVPIDLVLNNAAMGTLAGPSANLPVALSIPGTANNWLDTNSVSHADLILGRYRQATVVAWGYFASAGGIAGLFGKGHTAGVREWAIDWSAGSWEFRWTTNGTSQASRAITGSVSATWQLLVARRDAAGWRLSLNSGIPQTPSLPTGDFVAGTEEFQVGHWDAQFQMTGRVGHIGIWNRFLSDAEIFRLFNNAQGYDLTRHA